MQGMRPACALPTQSIEEAAESVLTLHEDSKNSSLLTSALLRTAHHSDVAVFLFSNSGTLSDRRHYQVSDKLWETLFLRLACCSVITYPAAVTEQPMFLEADLQKRRCPTATTAIEILVIALRHAFCTRSASTFVVVVVVQDILHVQLIPLWLDVHPKGESNALHMTAIYSTLRDF